MWRIQYKTYWGSDDVYVWQTDRTHTHEHTYACSRSSSHRVDRLRRWSLISLTLATTSWWCKSACACVRVRARACVRAREIWLLRQGSRAHLGLLWQLGWHPHCCLMASAQTHRKAHEHTVAHWNYRHEALSVTHTAGGLSFPLNYTGLSVKGWGRGVNMT